MSESEREPELPASTVCAIAMPSTANTVVPRYIAAALDNCVAMLLAIAAAKSVKSDYIALQAPVLIGAYLGYYFVFEALICRTPGKLLTGLTVVDLKGERSSLYQVTVRTLFRLLEVNPLLLGCLPAAVSVVFSKCHQRLGDRVAQTSVVDARSLSASL